MHRYLRLKAPFNKPWKEKNLNCMKMSIFDETNISYTKHLDIVTGKKLQVLKLNENNKNSF